MISKLARISLATVFGFSLSLLAQTAPATPNAPSSAAAPAVAAGNRVATINIEGAIFSTNEGQRDFDVLRKKLEPKQADVKNLGDEVDSLKKQLSTQGDKMNDDARANLVKQIETKQKSFERARQDLQEDAQAQQGEVAQRLLAKLVPIIQKYVVDNGYGLLIDNSQPWPQGPVIMAGPAFDITGPIVDAYNAQSGVAAPTGGAKPAAARPTAPASKPAAPATKPPATTPPKQ